MTAAIVGPPSETGDRHAVGPVTRPSLPVTSVRASAWTIPTDAPESDGTLRWDRTTLVVVEVDAGGLTGLGYTYADAAAVRVVSAVLAPQVIGTSALDIPRAWASMLAAVRNIGRQGIAATAISATDNALWDLKARLLGVPVAQLIGLARPSIPAYGSGGFTSYTDTRLGDQLGGWARDGFSMVKLKIGREPAADPRRVSVARAAVGPDVSLFVDANGAFHWSDALRAAAWLAEAGVRWLEEPVTSDDVDGLRAVRDRAPYGLAITAGEYGWDLFHFRRLLDAGAVDVLQADATRCLGTTGFIQAAALSEARAVPLSTHCAPSLHAHLACATRPTVHVEWFHDHARIERLAFDGVPEPVDGSLVPDLSRAGFGLELRTADLEPYRVGWAS